MTTFKKISLLSTLALGTFAASPAAWAQDVQALQKQAADAYAEKSYARALELYQKAKAAGAVREPEEVDYRIVTSLFKTEKWDQALESGQSLAARAAWKARVHYLLGQIYYSAPHYGYRLGSKPTDKLVRGRDFPDGEGDQKPVQVDVTAEDFKATLKHFETAKVEGQKERDLAMRARFFAPIYPMPSDQEIDLNFDLSGFLPSQALEEYIQALEAGKGGDENIPPKAPYDPSWTYPKKVLYLYNEILSLDNSEDKHDSALALLSKGFFIQGYRQRGDSWARKWDAEKKQTIVRPYPFDHLEPIPVWAELVEKYPNDALAPQAQLFIAQAYEARGEVVKALAAYRVLVDKFGKTKWAGNGRAAIQRITEPSVSLSLPNVSKPGTNPQATVYARNVATVDLAVYRVNLEEWIADQARLGDADTQFTSMTRQFGALKDVVKRLGAPVATWQFKTGEKGDYQGTSGQTNIPVKDLGAYLVVGSASGRRFGQIILVTDLAILKKSYRDKTFAFVVDAGTGKPLQGVNVVLKETYWSNGRNNVSVAQGRSDDAGFFEKNWVRQPNVYNSNVAAFAWIGNRYAVTGMQGGYWGYYGNRDEARVLSYMDRPVYRPGQKAYFRQVLTSRVAGGDWKVSPNSTVEVSVRNPKGEVAWAASLKTNEFGAVSGEFTIPDGAPLGEWNVQARVPASNINVAASGANRFRVEEYKRPEFEVTVDAPAEAKRPGEVVAARISAKYYFGAPVPNATVKYTVRRTVWWSSYSFPQPFDWLYRYWGVGDYDTGRRNIGGEGSGEIVKEGTVKTDAKGFAELSFQTSNLPENADSYWRSYANPLFNIEVEVTDASRRTIEGQGSVRVADQQYFAFLNLTRGYFMQGDRVPVELRTQDANNMPVKTAGKMVVYRQLPGNQEEKVFEEAVQTDEKGYANWIYEAKEAGELRVAYEANDAWGKSVRASTNLWVAGEGLNKSAIRLRGVTILLDKRHYEEGQNLKALLVADKPGTTVLLTQESGGEILRRDVYTIAEKSREITIPVEHRHVPNFFLAAATVQDYEVFQAQQEVFVPPVRELLNVSVTPDKDEYKPGEKGTFTLKATDYRGAPARAELSLALVDSSLFYIQKDYTPDVRQFYYGERRTNSVNLDSYRSGNFEARTETDSPLVNYEQYGWEMPDGLGQLNLDPRSGLGYYGRLSTRGAMFRRSNIPLVGDMPVPASAPMAPPMAMAMAADAREERGQLSFAAAEMKKAGGSGGGGDAVAPQIRSNFAETAYWSPAVVTEGGSAKVEVEFPDSLTQWQATARGLTPSVQVGSAETTVTTKKDLLVRLQTPRFFVERDEVVLSANVHNYGKKAEKIRVELQLDNLLALKSGANANGSQVREIEVGAGEEQRLDWPVRVIGEGQTTVTVAATTASNSDGVRQSFPVMVHGVQRFSAQAGTLTGDGRQRIVVNLPKERRQGASQLNVQFNPSMAAQMLDALPYLADYPYGCVEQTMSRFLPAVVTAKTLTDAGINLETLRRRAAAYDQEAKTQPVGQRIANSGYSYPKGMAGSRDLERMASRFWYRSRSGNPLFDEAVLGDMVQTGLNRLYGMQRPDGGWGWWPGSSSSDSYMSAYVVYGLATARASEVKVRGDVLDRGFRFITERMRKEENLHLLTYLAYARSLQGAFPADLQSKVVGGRLFEQRERLTAYSKALLALALHNSGDKEKAAILVRNLENTAKVDEKNGTARWTQAREWWYWYNNDEETNAMALRAFVQIDPSNKLTGYLMKWLTTNARAGHWSSTKATAETVNSLAGYVTKFKELDVDYTLEVTLNGGLKRTYQVNRDNALFFDNRFVTGDFFLKDGANELVVEKKGKGNLYWNAYSEYFSLEEPIQASGNEIGISRRYYKLTRVPMVEEGNGAAKAATASEAPAAAVAGRGLAVMGKVAPGRMIMPRPIPVAPAEPEYNRTLLKDGDTLKSGDLVEVELVLEAANDYTYLVFEDMKAAGLEPVDLRSGYAWGDGLSSNVELRDSKVAFFVDNLPQGKRVLRYRMRAEIPGAFHALPTNGYAMYAPEVRAISAETRLNVQD